MAATSNNSKKHKTSNAPSDSASAYGGQTVLDSRLRSVLCHPLGLPLLCSFCEGEDPDSNDLGGLKRSSATWTPEQMKKLEGLFSSVVTSNPNCKEPQVTAAALIDAMEENELGFLKFHSVDQARVDGRGIVIQFGFGSHHDSWLKKLDQSVKYLDTMMVKEASNNMQFQKPILLIVIAMETSTGENGVDCEMMIGAFLCIPKGPKKETDDAFQMSLLWHEKANTLNAASKLFGQMLNATQDFSQWISSNEQADYEYFGSNCCRVGDEVFRSYDNRYHMTARSPSVYLTCQDIVGKCRTVVELPVRGSEPGGEDDDFWHKGKAQTLLIIAVPFRTGGHQAKQPAAFVPIIQQLQELHKKGFVHGDIRACNIVFCEDPKEGWLIDFDFGGEAGVVKYPNGYKQTLDDGRRIGEEGNEIKKVDDWYGLGQLIFDLHRFDRSNMTAPDLTLWELEGFWTTTPDGWEEGLPFKDQVVKLLKFVGSYRHDSYKLHPIFKAFLEN